MAGAVRYDPAETGRLVTRRFLQTPHLLYDGTIHYAEVCAWLGALQCAGSSGGGAVLRQKLIERFEPLFSRERAYLPPANHVDFNMFGALPLELYRITGEERYKKMGMPYAGSQWELPDNASVRERELFDQGYTWQTRMWLDDMYMITVVQSRAYAVTGERIYIERAAAEMAMYLDKLQRPNGLFYHTPEAPFYWGRGNGWMAAGMSLLLETLPAGSPYRSRIMAGYALMLENLKKYQGADGMWRQLLDDPQCWPETSCTAMFAYSMLTGINRGWLPAAAYSDAALRAWNALAARVDSNGDVQEVCAGTAAGSSAAWYYDRPRITGDYHGQAPVLWCVNALADTAC
jgi:rhamnogalacturonyl hydrolase YesR